MPVVFEWSANTVPVISTIMGLFLVVFGLSSAFVKERLYLSEAVLTTLIGSIVGPHVLRFFDPTSWSGLNTIVLELSRLVIAMQIMAAIICLPIQYYKIHWKSVFTMLVPVMTAQWLISAALIYAILGVPFELALALGGTLSPTDPILANSIVKGRFADRHVPRHVRHLLSAESACNDSTAALFIQLAVLLIKYPGQPGKIVGDFFLWVVAYEMLLGAVYGLLIGYLARRALQYAHEHDLIDAENFLSFALALSIFIDGSSMLLKLNDFVSVVVGAVAFAWDGDFYEQTKSSQIQEVLDNLANAWLFVFNGAIIPWPTILASATGPAFWQYVLAALAILTIRRLPITLACYRLLPSLTTIKEAAFVGHFGPMAGGAMYYMAFMRDKLGGQYADPDKYPLIEPIVQFVIVASIVVHGCSVSMFKLGSVTVRTLSAGSSLSLGRRSLSIGRRSRSAGRGRSSRPPVSGVFSVSAPINARPLYGSSGMNSDVASADGADALGVVGTPRSSAADTARGASADLLRKDGSLDEDLAGAAVVRPRSYIPSALPVARETTIEIREAHELVLPAREPLRLVDSEETVAGMVALSAQKEVNDPEDRV